MPLNEMKTGESAVFVSVCTSISSSITEPSLPHRHEPEQFGVVNWLQQRDAFVHAGFAVDPYVGRRFATAYVTRCDTGSKQGRHCGAERSVRKDRRICLFDRADAIVHAQCARAPERGHAQGGMRRYRGGVQAADLGERRGVAHLPEQVEAVCCSPRRPCRGRPGRRRRAGASTRRDAAGELHVRGGAVRDAAAVAGEQFDVGLSRCTAWTPIRLLPSTPRRARRAKGPATGRRGVGDLSCAVSWMWAWIGRPSSSARVCTWWKLSSETV